MVKYFHRKGIIKSNQNLGPSSPRPSPPKSQRPSNVKEKCIVLVKICKNNNQKVI